MVATDLDFAGVFFAGVSDLAETLDLDLAESLLLRLRLLFAFADDVVVASGEGFAEDGVVHPGADPLDDASVGVGTEAMAEVVEVSSGGDFAEDAF